MYFLIIFACHFYILRPHYTLLQTLFLHHVVKVKQLQGYSSSSFELKDALWVLQAIEYDVGDVLEILPGQDLSTVDVFIRRCNLDPDSLITVSLLRLVQIVIVLYNEVLLPCSALSSHYAASCPYINASFIRYLTH